MYQEKYTKNWISAWHGTKPEFIESIIENGLKLPGTKIKDKIIKIKSYTPLKDNEFGIKDWENAIFASKNIHNALSYYDNKVDYYHIYNPPYCYLLVEVKMRPDGFTSHKSKDIGFYYLNHGFISYKEKDEIDIYRIVSEEDVIVVSITLVPSQACWYYIEYENFIDFID